MSASTCSWLRLQRDWKSASFVSATLHIQGRERGRGERTRSIRGLPEKLLHLEDLLVINGIIHSKVLVGQGRVGSNSGHGQVGSGRGRGRVIDGSGRGLVGTWSGHVRSRSGWVEVGPWSGQVRSRSSHCRVRSRSCWVEVLQGIEVTEKSISLNKVVCH